MACLYGLEDGADRSPAGGRFLHFEVRRTGLALGDAANESPTGAAAEDTGSVPRFINEGYRGDAGK